MLEQLCTYNYFTYLDNILKLLLLVVIVLNNNFKIVHLYITFLHLHF